MSNNKVVKFIMPWRQYNTGELARFAGPTADGLVRSGFAEYHKSGDAPAATRPKLRPELGVRDRRETPDGLPDDLRELPEGEVPGGVIVEDENEGLEAQHAGFGKWFIYRDGEQISGPHTRAAVVKMGLLEEKAKSKRRGRLK
ncbi:hypothetical protein LCGC14_0232120 [marine sediment metagenome]|uniref:Uncharacterized protein n=1 Tax=marine sediment metagenome TaxID=412755 RepID=A0A0F9UEK2_9ZZZZ